MLVQCHQTAEVRVHHLVCMSILATHLWHFEHSPCQQTAMLSIRTPVADRLQLLFAWLWCLPAFLQHLPIRSSYR